MYVYNKKLKRRNKSWLTRLMTIASPAAHVLRNAPPALLRKATASTKSTLTLASVAAAALTYALLVLPRLNNFA
jgi:hypothetical protein